MVAAPAGARRIRRVHLLTARRVDESSNGIYRGGGTDLMLQLTKDAQGYVGTYKVGFLLT